MPFALFAFDICVELSQLGFIAVVLGFYVPAMRINPTTSFES